MVERVAEMADAVVAHLQRLAARQDAMGQACMARLQSFLNPSQHLVAGLCLP